MRTFVFSSHPFDQPFLEKAAAAANLDFTFTERSLNLNSVDWGAGYDYLSLFSNDDASAPVLARLAGAGIKGLALRSVGYDHVDLGAAKALGIKVANVPEYSPYAIAEHAVAMLMALNRKLHEAEMLIHMQDFRLDTLVGFDLHGKTVGIVGTGKIGMAFARIMHGFGCRLLGFDPAPHPQAGEVNMAYVSLNELLAQSEVVALNCPLNEHTLRMIGRPQFAAMKPGAILINTARGAVIDTDALIEHLESGHLGGACLDVYEREKGLFFFDWRDRIIRDSVYVRLRGFKNVLITGHQAFLTREALRGIAETTAMNIACWAKGDKSPNELY
ncbi:MAG: 2-hydroxyacid dehydrogenase [Saprospiraceae bacterium]